MQENIVRKRTLVTVFVVIALTSTCGTSYFAQGRGGPAQPDTRTAPRWPDGHVNLGAVPGSEMDCGTRRRRRFLSHDRTSLPTSVCSPPMRASLPIHSLQRTQTEPDTISAVARSLFAVRVLSRQEPYTRCKPSSGARQVATAYGTQFLEVPELKRLYIIETGGAHSFRTVS